MTDQQPRERLEAEARKHMMAAYGTPGNELGITLFVSHHLEEVEAPYWIEQLGTSKPEPRQVLELLELCPRDDEEEEAENRDFTLPDGTSNYMICVEFDAAGRPARIDMESQPG